MSMGMFEMSAEQVAQWREQCRELVEPRVNSEEVVAAAAFRRGGATASYAASKAGGGLIYAGIRLMNKKKAGGLPDKVMIAVTPDKVYAFKLKVGREYKLGDEAAIWDRGGLKIGTDRKSGMTALTIESPAEGEKVTLVGISVKDDPVSQGLMAVLQGNGSQPA
jgi:hypothetical protein